MTARLASYITVPAVIEPLANHFDPQRSQVVERFARGGAPRRCATYVFARNVDAHRGEQRLTRGAEGAIGSGPLRDLDDDSRGHRIVSVGQLQVHIAVVGTELDGLHRAAQAKERLLQARLTRRVVPFRGPPRAEQWI